MFISVLNEVRSQGLRFVRAVGLASKGRSGKEAFPAPPG